MSHRTAQCQECATIFECAPRGIVPKLCPECKKGAKPGKANGRRASKSSASPTRTQSLDTALAALREDRVVTQDRLYQLDEAIEVLEKIGA